MSERVPRLNLQGELMQMAGDEFVGRAMSRKEAEKNGNSPVVCVLLFRDNNGEKEMLLQKRAKSKSRWPKKWEGSVIETGQMKNPDDSWDWEPEHPNVTAARGLLEEIGLENVQLDKRTFFHRYVDVLGGSSLITIYTAIYDKKIHGDLVPNSDEVARLQWVSTERLLRSVRWNSRKFAPGFREMVKEHPEVFL